MQQRRRTCPVSGLPLEDVASSLKTADGRALDLDKVEQKVPEFRELRRIADTIDGRVLVGFGRHRSASVGLWRSISAPEKCAPYHAQTTSGSTALITLCRCRSARRAG